MSVRRLVFLALAAMLAIVAAQDAARNWQRSMPIAGRPGTSADPFLVLRWSETLLADPQRLAAQAGATEQAARRLLSASPLKAMALRQLALADSARTNSSALDPLLLAERISRRDLLTQIVLIDLTARRDDLAGTLAHYDRALVVHSDVSPTLYPVMAKAISDPSVRMGLQRYADRDWLRDFLGNAERYKADPADLFALQSQLRGLVPETGAPAGSSSLLASLVAKGDHRAAKELVRNIARGSADALDRIGFSPETTDPRLAPLTWSLQSGDAIEASTSGAALDIRIEPERSSIVAERTTLLAPGRYRLTQQVVHQAGSPPAALEWTVTCLGGASAQLFKSSVAEGEATPPSIDLQFAIPAGCVAQKWSLRASGQTSQLASTARIAGLNLVKE